jgi:hypothetical protein
VYLFAADTVVRMQIYAASAGDAEPQDVVIGTSLVLKNPSAGIWTATVTTTKGVAKVVGRVGDVAAYVEGNELDQDYGLIDVRFIQSILDGNAS